MSSDGKPEVPATADRGFQEPFLREGMKNLVSLSGSDALNLILESETPREVVQGMARVDFYWLVKKIGEDDALPLMELASRRQWEHMLDMELWEGDRLDLHQATLWIERLMKVSPERLVGWLFSEGEFFCYYYLWQAIQVEVRRGEEALDLPEGFFTLDDLHYIRILDKEHEEELGNLLRQMALQDYDRYRSMLLGLVNVVPAELEEEMYRLRSVRLAEDGFLPFEEANSLYAYLKADPLKRDALPDGSETPFVVESGTPVPMIPLLHVKRESLLAVAADSLSDPLFLDALRLEFAGLCNQLISADRLRVGDLDVLLGVCRKAAGYLNLGLERLSGSGTGSGEEFLRKCSLATVFRAGFSATLELRWEAERRLKQAWFARTGQAPGFWGEEWAGILKGILQKRPLYYTGREEEGGYRAFERLSEVASCRESLRKLFAMDRLFAILALRHPIGKQPVKDPLVTYHSLLITYWARRELRLAPGFEPISAKDFLALFDLLRRGKTRRPFAMQEHRARFLRTLTADADALDGDEREVLQEGLSGLWEEFREEYAWVSGPDLDARLARLILVQRSAGGAPN